MCIAIAKPQGVSIPTEDILISSFLANPDGAGFCFNDNGKVIIHKGMMSLDEFLEDFYFYNDEYDFKNKSVLIHTRIATQGGINPQMTHPFPLSSNIEDLERLDCVSDYAIIHNGIIALTTDYYHTQTLSDTAIFIKDYLYNISKKNNWFGKEEITEKIENLIKSKMAILNGNGNIIMTNGFIEDNGIFYSNSSYKYYNYYAKDSYFYNEELDIYKKV